MIYLIQAIMLTFIEALCCEIYFDIFHSKKHHNKYMNYLLFILLYLGFLFVSMISTELYDSVKITVNIYVSIYGNNIKGTTSKVT